MDISAIEAWLRCHRLWLEAGSFIATMISGIGIICVFLTLMLQRKSVRHQSLLHLHKYLTEDTFSSARRRVRTHLYQKPYPEWTDTDKDDASFVCTSYDQAGLLISSGTVDRRTADIFLRSSWGESICDQYEALTPFLSHYQTPNRTGYEFFTHFTTLYHRAYSLLRRRSLCRRLKARIFGQEIKIVSGGQTGADRAALDVAIALDLPYGGWCPKGGWAEDMPHPPGLLQHYKNMQETPSSNPNERTDWNVRDSDATLIIINAHGLGTSPGTVTTKDIAHGKYPNREIKVIDVGNNNATTELVDWLRKLGPSIKLNVAGPRESETPGLYACARSLLLSALKTVTAR